MVHPINQFKKAGGAYVTRDELEEALAPIRAALEVSDLDAAIDELDGIEPVSGDPTTDQGRHFAESSLDSAEPEKEALSEPDKESGTDEAPKKSRAKRKPEGQDPLGLVPDVEED